MNISNYAHEVSFHLTTVLDHLNHLKLVLSKNERLVDSLIVNTKLAGSAQDSSFKYWDQLLENKISDERFFLALFASSAPFLFTLILVLVSMFIVDQLFNLKKKFQQKSGKSSKTIILYSENGGFCHKIAVVDEMKRKKRYLITSHHHKPIAADFNLPDENKVPMILIKNEFIKDNRDDLSNLNEIERINNQEAVVINVNNLDKRPSELKRITTEDITNVLQMNSIKNPKSYDISINRKKYSFDNTQETKSIEHTMPSLSEKYNRRKTTGDFTKKNETRKLNIFSVTKVYSQNESTNDKMVNDSEI